MPDQLLTDVAFNDLPLRSEILDALAEAGFSHCTPIQAATLPKALGGEDVAGQAQTGTGKTAAFLLATMNLLMESEPLDTHQENNPRALILAPTRELALQIGKDAELFGNRTGLRYGVVYGGTGYESQRQMVADGLDILIGTPGRVIDYFRQGVFNLKGAQVMVLDEADRMFDLGFIRDIRFLLRRLPPASRRVNMLFSATLSHRVTELAYEHMNEPELVNVSPESVTVDHVTQRLYHVSKDEKIALLLGLLKSMDASRTIVFVNTKRGADMVTGFLAGNGYEADVLSGDVPQKKRLRLLSRFQSGELPVLVATDVAARGLHIPDVSHVVNYDLPQDAEDYVHRIGRTARAGASGDAISFACEEFVFSLEDIHGYIGAEIPVVQVTDAMLVEPKAPVRLARRPRNGAPGDKRGDGRGDGRGRRSRRPRRRPQDGGARSAPAGESGNAEAGVSPPVAGAVEAD
ncbi:MAG: DEAD/DEAH box helicase [Pseudomonadota bacterium]